MGSALFCVVYNVVLICIVASGMLMSHLSALCTLPLADVQANLELGFPWFSFSI